MGMIVEDIKRHLNKNYFLMMLIATVVGVMALPNGKTMELLGYKQNKFIFQALTFVFLLYSFELSRDSLQMEKINRRLEWLIGNGVKKIYIYISYSVANFIMTQILTLPLQFIICFRIGLNVELLFDYGLTTLLLTMLLNGRILSTVNMNKFKNIILVLSILNLCFIFIHRDIYKYLLLIVLNIHTYTLVTNERIVTAYY